MKHTTDYNETDIDIDELDTEEIDTFVAIVEEKLPRKKKLKKAADEYVNKDEMWEEFRLYYKSLGDAYNWDIQKLKTKHTYGHVSAKLISMINDIATKMGYRPNFINYSYLDEMRSDAKVKMVKALRDCSFKCYVVAKVMDKRTEVDTEGNIVNIAVYMDEKFYKKHQKYKERKMEAIDELIYKDGVEYIKFKNNIFGYFSRIAENGFVNRIKREHLVDDTKKRFQEQQWTNALAQDTWCGVRRPKHMDHDENEMFYGE